MKGREREDNIEKGEVHDKKRETKRVVKIGRKTKR